MWDTIPRTTAGLVAPMEELAQFGSMLLVNRARKLATAWSTPFCHKDEWCEEADKETADMIRAAGDLVCSMIAARPFWSGVHPWGESCLRTPLLM